MMGELAQKKIDDAWSLFNASRFDGSAALFREVALDQQSPGTQRAAAWLGLATVWDVAPYLLPETLADCLNHAIEFDPQNLEARIRWCNMAWAPEPLNSVGYRPTPAEVLNAYRYILDHKGDDPDIAFMLESLARRIEKTSV